MPGWVDCCYFGVCHLFTICMKTITIEVSEKGLEDLKKQLEIEKAKPVRWRAEDSKEYWYIDAEGDAITSTECGHSFDDWRYSQRNYFKTAEEAKKYKKYLECVAKIKDSSDFIPDWENGRQEKHFIGYLNNSKKLTKLSVGSTQGGEIVYYETPEDTDRAREQLKDEYEYVFAYERGKV